MGWWDFIIGGAVADAPAVTAAAGYERKKDGSYTVNPDSEGARKTREAIAELSALGYGAEVEPLISGLVRVAKNPKQAWKTAVAVAKAVPKAAKKATSTAATVKKGVQDAAKAYRVSKQIKPNYDKGGLRWLEMDKIKQSRQNLGGNNYYHAAQTSHTKVRGGTSSYRAMLDSPHQGNGGGTYMAHGSVWPEHYGAETVIEFPEKIFGNLKATNHLGAIRDESVVDMGNLVFNYRFNPRTAKDIGIFPMRPYSPRTVLHPGESVQTLVQNGRPREWVMGPGRSDIPLKSAGDLKIYDRSPDYLNIYSGNQTVVPTSQFRDAVKNSTYTFYTKQYYPSVHSKLGFPVQARGIHYGPSDIRWSQPQLFNPFQEYFLSVYRNGGKLISKDYE